MLCAEEDRINKPFRPVPQGLITEHGSFVRSCVWFSLLITMGVAMGVLHFTLLWIALATWYNFYGGDKHWFVKNQVSTATFVYCGFAPFWLFAHNNVWTTAAIAWTSVLAVYEGIAVTVQVRAFSQTLHTKPRCSPACASVGAVAPSNVFGRMSRCSGSTCAPLMQPTGHLREVT